MINFLFKIILIIFFYSNFTYANQSNAECNGNGCLLGNFYLNKYKLSVDDVLEITDKTFVESIRKQIINSTILENSSKLSLPSNIENNNYIFNIISYLDYFSTKDTIVKNTVYTYFYSGGLYPKFILGIPIDNSFELWLGTGLFYGPTDLGIGFLNISSITTRFNQSAEIKKIIYYNNVFMISYIYGLNFSYVNMKNNVYNENFNFSNIPWNGNYIINYETYLYNMSNKLSLSYHIKDIYFELYGGSLTGNIILNDYFSANGELGPLFSDSDKYNLNISTKKTSSYNYFRDVFGFDFLYELSDNFKLCTGYETSSEFKTHITSLKLIF